MLTQFCRAASQTKHCSIRASQAGRVTRCHTFVFLGCFHRLQGHRLVSVRCCEICVSFFQLRSLAHVTILCLNSFSSDPLDSGTLFHGKKKKQRRRRWSGEYGLLPRGFPQWNRALRQIKSEAASVGSTEGKKESLFFPSSSCFICMLFPFSSRPFRVTSLTSRGCLTIFPLRDD